MKEYIMPKYYIYIDSPLAVNNQKVIDDIKCLAERNIRSKSIILACTFVAPNDILEKIFNKFQQIKNNVYFNLNKK